MHYVRFPKIGANIVEGMVGAWRKREGDSVAVGEPLVELITDKATFDLEAESEGTLRKILAPEKSTVPVDYILALVGEPEEPLPDVSSENEKLMEAYRQRARAAEWGDVSGEGRATAVRHVRAMPRARQLAKEHGIDLSRISPAKGEIITEEDVRDYIQGRRPT